VAEARVSEPDERVVIELWAQPGGLPRELTARLVARAFSLPAVHPHRPVLVCVPRRDVAVLALAHGYVNDSSTRAAGATCLIEGWVDDVPHAEPDEVRHVPSAGCAR
jgi:hypothetical protein